ncbi:uncharacterized protein LOC123511891 isoform X3 [Portunus trituberculatus]|uniref:uncharacterized protein LOC123511891 isoform X3 n=1 Tax=Portunus trituberculatus TaxID=210409 RepID=UPI001E1D1336|nr:uncharacterized protein LOC123511891 isoform X3 [Portunus trituberculatus]
MIVKVFAVLVVLATAVTAFELDDQHVGGKVQREKMTGLAGESVSLYCLVDQEKCGELHSMKWSKGSIRQFIYSWRLNESNAEASLLGRTNFYYSNETTNSTLEIFPIRIEDEGEFSCIATYFDADERCSIVHYVDLTIHAIPSYPQLSFEDGSRVENATTVGPFDEGEVLTLTCESSGGKPVAQVTWYNGTQPITGEYSAIMDEDKTGTGRNVLRISLSRADLGTTLNCEAVNEAIDSPHSAFVTVDVNVPPLSVIASGAESPLHEGDDVTLECVARGARPAAVITWLNGTVPVTDAVTEVNVETDNTYESRSRLQFEATRFENERTFTCEVTNVVLENRNQKPVRREVTLDVRYVPIVRVYPESNITVNESMDVLIFCKYSANPSKLTHVHWYQDLRQVDVAGQPDKYGNGNVDHPSLLIRNSSSLDMGEYTCRVSNEVGASRVVNSVFVSVNFRPQVQVVMDRTEPVSEEDRVNVTLICEAVKANPVELVRVRWYLQGELLKELPECDGNASLYGSNSELCDIDPARMLLENVFKDFHGNYSCEGMNEAGWGPRSADAELVVHYAPGPAFINKPSYVKKGTSLELTCSVEDAGNPAANQFRWFRGSHLVPDVTTATWTINPVSLETEDNFTCVPFNVEGEGDRASVFIDVQAAPVFIDRLPPYYGALMSAKRVSLSCRVECSPLCSIEWLKNDMPLLNDTHYSISTRRLPPDSSSGDLESVSSELTWQMDRWPGGMLDRDLDNANYTCNSSENDAGPGVISHTFFKVEYPPEQIVVSETYIQVGEGEIPPKVICNASSYPEPTYVWQHAGQTVSPGAVLHMDFPIKRSRAGEYQCIAENRHGEMKAATNFDVLFKPECKIDREDGGSGEDAHILLICRAAANPEEVAFRWRLLNETLTQDITSEGLESRLRLPATSESLGTYYCYVNNTLGESIPCEIDVTGVAGIIEKLADDNVIVISAIVAAVIVLVIIICVVIIVICRRQRHAGKYNGTNNLQARENPEGTSPRPDPFSPATVQPVHKWPLRPGVHVHVNSLTSLTDDCKPLHNNNTVTTLSPPSTQAPPPPHHSLPHHHLNHHANHLANPYHQQQLQKHQYSNNHSNHKGNSHHLKHSHALQPHQQYPTLENKRSGSSSHRKFKTNSQTLPRQTSTDIPKREERSPSSLSHSPASNPSPHPHPQPNSPATNTNNSKNKAKNCDLDANYHTGNSVVVQTKPDSNETSATGRKRKKPGQDPEGSKPPSTGHKDNGVPSSPDDDTNKQTFYENLPFHGMQPPPNKDAPENIASTSMGSRPPSQLSQQASSGYGSTRSRKDEVTLIKPSSEESSKVAGGRGSSPKVDATSTGVRRQNSESYGSMRSTSGRQAKGPLARTAAYLSMRLPGGKKRARAKASEDSHQMIETQPSVKAVPNQSQGKDQARGPSEPPQTTQFTSETRHVVTSRPDLNTVTVETSQNSRLTVTAPQADPEANNNNIFYGGAPRSGAPSGGHGNERFQDPRTYDPAGAGLPVPAPRNGTNGRGHTYQNLPTSVPAADGSASVQRAAPPPFPQPVACENRKTGSYGSAQNPTPSSSSSSSSPSSSYYPAQYPSQYPPQYQRNPSLYKQYPSSTSLKETQPSVPYTKSSNSRQSFSSSTFPHRMENQSHPATSYPNTNHSHTATSYPNSQSHAYPQPANTQAHPPKYPPGVVYADLALSRNGQPNHYRRDLNTEYAILQFKGPVVGQEIDV